MFQFQTTAQVDEYFNSMTLRLDQSPRQSSVTELQQTPQRIGLFNQSAQLTPAFPDSLSDEFPHHVLNNPTCKKVQCFYCKKYGHMIRSCRYKRCRDKARKTKTILAQNSPYVENSLHLSLSATNSEAQCCSLIHDTATANMDISKPSNSEDSLRTEFFLWSPFNWEKAPQTTFQK